MIAGSPDGNTESCTQRLSARCKAHSLMLLLFFFWSKRSKGARLGANSTALNSSWPSTAAGNKQEEREMRQKGEQSGRDMPSTVLVMRPRETVARDSTLVTHTVACTQSCPSPFSPAQARAATLAAGPTRKVLVAERLLPVVGEALVEGVVLLAGHLLRSHRQWCVRCMWACVE